jgi:hypothetical protein
VPLRLAEPVRGYVAGSVAARNRNTRKAGRCAVSPSCHAAVRGPSLPSPCRKSPPRGSPREGGASGVRAGRAGAPKGRTAEPAPTRRPSEGPYEPPAGPVRARRWSGAFAPGGAFLCRAFFGGQRKRELSNRRIAASRRRTGQGTRCRFRCDPESEHVPVLPCGGSRGLYGMTPSSLPIVMNFPRAKATSASSRAPLSRRPAQPRALAPRRPLDERPRDVEAAL